MDAGRDRVREPGDCPLPRRCASQLRQRGTLRALLAELLHCSHAYLRSLRGTARSGSELSPLRGVAEAAGRNYTGWRRRSTSPSTGSSGALAPGTPFSGRDDLFGGRRRHRPQTGSADRASSFPRRAAAPDADYPVSTELRPAAPGRVARRGRGGSRCPKGRL